MSKHSSRLACDMMMAVYRDPQKCNICMVHHSLGPSAVRNKAYHDAWDYLQTNSLNSLRNWLSARKPEGLNSTEDHLQHIHRTIRYKWPGWLRLMRYIEKRSINPKYEAEVAAMSRAVKRWFEH